MTNEERLRQGILQMHASALRAKAAYYDMAAASVPLGATLRAFVEAHQASIDREVAGHPDLAELNVRLDGFYA